MAVLADGRARPDGRGRRNHFRNYAPEKMPYAIDRYTNEVNRLYGVMNKRLADRRFLAGEYSIADMACIGWVNGWKRQGQDIDEFPHLKRWLETRAGAAGGQARHGARRRAARGHRHEGSEGAGGAVRAACALVDFGCWLSRAEGVRLALPD